MTAILTKGLWYRILEARHIETVQYEASIYLHYTSVYVRIIVSWYATALRRIQNPVKQVNNG